MAGGCDVPYIRVNDRSGDCHRLPVDVNCSTVIEDKKMTTHTEQGAPCTCHPDDAPPVCQHRGTYGECRNAALMEALDGATGLLDRLTPMDKERFRSLITRVKRANDWATYGNPRRG